MSKNSFNAINEMNVAENGGVSSNLEELKEEIKDSFSPIKTNIRLSRCNRCDGLFFINIVTGEKIPATCKAYACDYCGIRKALKLQDAFFKYFSQFNHIRMFTFTFRTSAFDNAEAENKAACEIWRRFINNVRRSTSLSDAQRRCPFVRVLEFTKRGYPHFHCFMMEYMPIQVLNGIWQRAINQVLKSKGINGNINISYSGSADSKKNKGNFTPKSAAVYIAKYVLKAAQRNREKMRLWSKSASVSLFDQKVSTGEWIFFNAHNSILNLEGLCVISPLPAPGYNEKKTLFEIVDKELAVLSRKDSVKLASDWVIEHKNSPPV